ncbi:MAG TPA: GNAT family N-acetyltransferase [Gaiellales bacterium]|nr:GNAT family N-acetyltransferase [Gaiellales bacterium]
MNADGDRRVPPYRIVTERLVVRCWDPADAAALKEAIDSSLEHLRRWMPWAANNEPEPEVVKVHKLRRFRGQFDLGENFVYGVFDREESRVLGGTGLHPWVGDGALEIGYWVRQDAQGFGLISESTAALTRVAFELCAVDRLHIHCDPQNTRSRAVPVRLGYVDEGLLRRRQPGSDGTPNVRDSAVFSMFADGYASSPCARARLEAYDAVGARVL